MRDEVRKVFEETTDPVHPGFRNHLRTRLEAGRLERRPAVFRVTAMVVTGVLVLGAIVAIASGLLAGRPGPVGVPGGPAVASPSAPLATSTPTASPAPTATTPTPSASAAEATLPPFQCAAQTGGRPASTPVTPSRVQLGSQTGYDRFVIETNAAVPSWEVTPQSAPNFIQDPSGRPVTLAGTRGILVRVHGAGTQGGGQWAQDMTAAGTIREARELGNFEAVFSWGLGVSGSGCFRAFTLTGPDRLVVDVQSAG